ncbi:MULTISPECIES: DUF2147 domain-containing protein [unclassified Mucilaginibacter]|uniref:DUF2147 domain-containing protein n=1 Tax=unclassified Mucilaginibacter TaxID=2617802 RepID=UPI002AC9796A|nr:MULTISPECIES: DUF2147 domain-containing protein [unclassified Mucilaginibacter]MEB0280624.1 DUF2147 domain-containing protein [Mucilaginibacter sp. 10B2]MEB0300297.1 DUF2147 domain-containing protein [Mucilaginibacter sp. 5C4]WPX24958.1 DUF2147 domain-containing protein [Mucilaginibacter sp. 5C4]
MIKKAYLILFLAVYSVAASAQNADAILGRWINPSGEGQVQILKKGNKYYGKLAWMKFPNEADGKPKLDNQNPDKALQSRPKLGIELLKYFVFDGDNAYENGSIYDPKNGKTYSCKMTLNGDNLKIRGFIGIALLGRSEIWKRVR